MTRFVLFMLCVAHAVQAQPFRWTTFTSTSNAIDLLMVDSNVWSATTGGISRWNVDSGDITVFTNTDGLAMNQCMAIGHDEQGWIWAALADGRITRLNPENGDIRQNDDLSDDVFNVSEVLKSGPDVFVSTNNGIYRFQYLAVGDNYRVRESIRVLGDFPSNSSVYSLATDGTYLFAGTTEGLARAEANAEILSAPAAWENFTTGNSGLPENTVLSLFSDATEKLWISTPHWTVTFENGVWGESQAIDSVIAFTERNGFVYAATPHFLFRQNGSGWSQVSSDFNRISDIDFGIYNGSSVIYLAIGDSPTKFGGIAVWSDSTIVEPVSAEGLGGNDIADIAIDKNGKVWVTTDGTGTGLAFATNGVSTYENGNWTRLNRSSANNQLYFRSQPRNIAFDGLGGVWFSSEGGGVVWKQGDSTTFFDNLDPNGFDVNGARLRSASGNGSFIVTRVEEDGSGGIWMSNRLTDNTTGIGLLHATRDWIAQGNHPETWVKHSIPVFIPGVTQTNVNELIRDPLNRIWVGAHPDGTQSSVLDNRGTAADTSDDVWFGYDPQSIQDEAFTCFRDIDRGVLTWDIDQQGYLWVGTPSGGYYTQGGIPSNLNQLNFICVIDLPVGNRINDIHVDSQDNKWFATDNGVAVLDKNFSWIHVFQTATSVENPSGLTSNNVTSIRSNPQTGEIWIGTRDGLSRLESPYVSRTASLDKLNVYPNPYRADGTQRLYVNSMDLGGKFDELRVFTTTGRLVRELSWSTMINTGWDGRNGDGHLVSGGVYLVVATTESGSSVTGKVAVLGK